MNDFNTESESTPINQSSATQSGLHRRRAGAMLTGVCSGVAEYFHVDVTLVRVAATALTFVSGGAVIAYMATAAILPPDDSEPVADRRVGSIGHDLVTEWKQATCDLFSAALRKDKAAFHRCWDQQVASFCRACQQMRCG